MTVALALGVEGLDLMSLVLVCVGLEDGGLEGAGFELGLDVCGLGCGGFDTDLESHGLEDHVFLALAVINHVCILSLFRISL